jgi:hypothetical protein
MVSDDIYGDGTRYVSKERLLAMLDYEYKNLLDRLNPARGKDTRFFVFAILSPPASTRAPIGSTDGLVFASKPSPAPNPASCSCMSTFAIRQHNCSSRPSGFWGVNLVYAAFHQRSDIESFLAGLFDELSIARIEIDVVEFNGSALADQDARAWCLTRLRRQMTHAVVPCL